jgi:RNA polymerase sigma factor (sigma-70 family)
MSGFFDNEKFRKLLIAYPVKALELLYEQFYRSLFNIARSLTQDIFAAEDILQETFMHVWENRKILGRHDERSIENYLVRVVKYKSITHYKQVRQQDQRKALFVNGYNHHLNELSAEDKIIKAEVVEEIRSLISSFPRAERECLLLKIEGELTNPEIAEKLKVTVKAVERSLTSAQKRLRAKWLERMK